MILGSLLIPHPHSTLCFCFQTFLGLRSFNREFIGLSDLKSNTYLFGKKIKLKNNKKEKSLSK